MYNTEGTVQYSRVLTNASPSISVWVAPISPPPSLCPPPGPPFPSHVYNSPSQLRSPGSILPCIGGERIGGGREEGASHLGLWWECGRVWVGGGSRSRVGPGRTPHAYPPPLGLLGRRGSRSDRIAGLGRHGDISRVLQIWRGLQY